MTTWPYPNLNLNSSSLQPQTQINLSFNLNSTSTQYGCDKSNPILFLSYFLILTFQLCWGCNFGWHEWKSEWGSFLLFSYHCRSENFMTSLPLVIVYFLILQRLFRLKYATNIVVNLVVDIVIVVSIKENDCMIWKIIRKQNMKL